MPAASSSARATSRHGLRRIEVLPGVVCAFVWLCVRCAFAHVNRTQPEAPEGRLQERAKCLYAVDVVAAGERHDEAVHGVAVRGGGRAGKLAWRPGGGVNERVCVR